MHLLITAFLSLWGFQSIGQPALEKVYLSGTGQDAVLHVIVNGHDQTFGTYAFNDVMDHKTVKQTDKQHFVVREASSTFTAFTEIHYSLKDTTIICDSVLFNSPDPSYERMSERVVDVFPVGKNIRELDRKTDLNYEGYLDRLTGNRKKD